MKNFSIYILLAALVFTSCADSSNYKITGHISNAEGEYIYLDELKVTEAFQLDSTRISKNGTFEFKGNLSHPSFFILRLSPNNFITLLVDSAENVSINADAANFGREYAVEGSIGSSYVQELNLKLSDTKHKLDSIRSMQMALRNNANYATQKVHFDAEYDSVRNAQVEYAQEFIKNHPFSMANVLALYQKFSDESYVIQDLRSLQIAATALHSFYPNSEHVQALYYNTIELMKIDRSQKLRQFINEQGTSMPEIALPDQHGKEVKLSSYLGKCILLHFWSAYDKNSRIMNPTLVEAYEKYRKKGFEIYQVSVDDDEEAWKTAIKEDKLTWTNVGDMKGSNSAIIHYNVKAVPSNYLIDKEGNIVAKNLQGPQLDKALKTLLK
ncbi:MAG: thioredoxin-like domain-containing protein [Mangrovibacterium sp.]